MLAPFCGLPAPRAGDPARPAFWSAGDGLTFAFIELPDLLFAAATPAAPTHPRRCRHECNNKKIPFSGPV